ncbi:FG-GAP repeat domain-containing protein [Streptomyces sp. NPDC001678]|uniref:FG-GAP repeat domain-containing protein n=1 Tax=Streptomyces sp. NPDC001678 TaxID=3364599 RepID=UPI0036AFB5CA
MPAPPPRRRGRARWRSLFTCALAGGLAAAAVPPLAAAAPISSSERVDSRQSDAQRAAAQAAESGEPVEVISRRTESSSVFANPSGTFTEERYAVPQRVRKDRKLVDIDATLRSVKGGKLSPKATAVGVEFSGGGPGPLATITRGGRSIALSWPKPLPKPTVDGDTATYPDVLPDVDLKLRAGSDGFAQLLVVKSPQAAANPELKTIKFGMSADGVKVSTDEHGNLSAVNPAGQEVFQAPTPRMWDSSTRQAAPTRAVRSVAAVTPVAEPTKNEFEPGAGAKESAMPIEASKDQLALTPDQSLLNGKDTRYPVYIDPYVSGGRQAWALAYKKYPNSAFFNGSGWGGSGKSTNDARIGYENETDGLGRSFFQMDTKNLWDSSKQIVKSTFRIKNTWSWSCQAREVQIWDTGTIHSKTSWNDQPKWINKIDSVKDAKGWGSSCPGGNLAFDVTAATKQAQEKKWPNWTLGLRAGDESDTFGWKKFDAKSATLSTEYESPPNTPTDVGTNPSVACHANPRVTIGDTDIQLYAKISDPDGGTVKARFNMWHTDGTPSIFSQIVSVTNGTVARVTVPRSVLKDGALHSWQVRADDGRSVSSWAPGEPCRFTVDKSRPSNPPAVASAEYPDGSSGWPANTGTVRTPGTFTFSAGGVKDVEKYEYWTDWNSAVNIAKPDVPGGSASVKITPMAAGPHKVYVRSLDGAGNRSDEAAYLFYTEGLKKTDEPGDLNGDGNPDMYGVRTNGDLRIYAGLGDGSVGPGVLATNQNFKDSLITHRGDWTDDGYEDLIERRFDTVDKVNKLYVRPNNGRGELTDTPPRELRLYDEQNNHWQKASQILAIGDVDGPLDIDGDGVIGEADRPGYPDLLVKEGDQLWLYFGSPSGYLDENLDQPPLLIGDGGWSNYDILAPGDVSGNKRSDMIARERTTGALYLYQGIGTAGEGLGDRSTRIQIGRSWWPTTRPLITSGGDADNDGVPDLWSTTDNDSAGLLFYPKLAATGHGDPRPIGTGGWSLFQSLS